MGQRRPVLARPGGRFRRGKLSMGSLLDPDAASSPGLEGMGPRPFLSRAHMLALRALLVPYAPTMLLLIATNYPPIGEGLFRLSNERFWIAATVGILVIIAVLTFCVLLAMSLHHYFRGHSGPRPASWWLWVILLLNVAGVVAYYLRIIEPEQKSLLSPG
jgi:hypothetical protein